jgi:RNA polymerase sigma factor (sigma-70 family)
MCSSVISQHLPIAGLYSLQANGLYNEMIGGCRQNHRKAQEQLYRSFYAPMMAFCMRYTKNQEDAKEVLNNGFLKVFQHIGSYNPALASLYTWIRSIIVHAAIDFIRSKSKMQQVCELDVVTEPEIPDSILAKLDAEELLRIIRLLPPATQAVFNLHVIDGYNHREIAAMAGISEGTSKWHLSEARKLLRKYIQQFELKV